MTRRAILVLGMHRSGTSALVRALGLLGAALPRSPMPATADNPLGYWESAPIARFHNRLLESAGTRWNDDAPIAPGWFAADERGLDEAEAAVLLEGEFGAAPVLAFKDPRLCRLLPLWSGVLRRQGIDAVAVLALRDPREVAGSLRARLGHDAFRPAAIAAPARSTLLWLRHVLDAERDSRGMPRAVVDYADLVADWRTALAPVIEVAGLPPPSRAAAESLDAFLSADRRRQRVPTGESAAPPPLSAAVSGLVRTAAGPAGDEARRDLDRIAAAFDGLRGPLAPHRGRDPASAEDRFGEAILRTLAGIVAAGPPPVSRRTRAAGPRVLFLSAAPASAGHVYRVEHAVGFLAARGWSARWLPLDDPSAATAAAEADAVTVFRGAWGAPFAEIHRVTRERRVPLWVDIDDLVFDPVAMAGGEVPVMDRLGPEERERWVERAVLHRRALAAADGCVVTTAALASAATPVAAAVRIVGNGLDARMVTAADRARLDPKPSALDGRPRIGFASGTPTHRRDFATVVGPLAAALDRHPHARLVVVGHLDPASFPELAARADRIEVRRAVPLPNLHGELARFDVNLAPLETGSLFCAAKSPIRCTAAALVGVPSVAAATDALAGAVVDGETGFVAVDDDSWAAALDTLLHDPARRTAMGEAARVDAAARFGPAVQEEILDRTYGAILGAGVRPTGGGG